MRKHSIFFFFAAIALALATFFVVTAREPEAMRVTSDDGRVTISGFARASLPFFIRQEGAVEGFPLRGEVYHLEPDTLTLEEPATVQFSLEGIAQPEQTELYAFDTATSMWKRLDASRSTPEKMEASVDRLGQFALGDACVVAAPNFLTTFDALRLQAPANAVGYQMVVGIQLTSESASPVVQLQDQTEIGGCGGTVGAGEHEEYSQITQDAHVLVNDVETPVTFIFRARWFIGARGCPQEKPFARFSSVIN